MCGAGPFRIDRWAKCLRLREEVIAIRLGCATMFRFVSYFHIQGGGNLEVNSLDEDSARKARAELRMGEAPGRHALQFNFVAVVAQS